ncbi:hypothetical protein AB1K91_17675 [Terribacillus sp. 179-K 1B1 HS]|uniref:hypothetical protein n=1 Tax=Terribacillus sp. 179-K 1B1 HS TaxID=3142388 RepID=UPI0039A12BCB
MGIDYLVCEVCGDAFPDVGYYGYCGGCESALCGGCVEDMGEKYGRVDPESEFAEDYGEESPCKCDECTKPKLDTEKFETLMYFLIKGAAKYDFAEFLENAGLTEKDYEDIEAYLKTTYGIKTY